jgi:hypothetical protein
MLPLLCLFDPFARTGAATMQVNSRECRIVILSQPRLASRLGVSDLFLVS